MDSIGNSHHDQRTLGGRRETRVGSVQASTGRFLDLLDPGTAFANDGTNQNVRDEQTEGIGLGVLAGRLA